MDGNVNVNIHMLGEGRPEHVKWHHVQKVKWDGAVSVLCYPLKDFAHQVQTSVFILLVKRDIAKKTGLNNISGSLTVTLDFSLGVHAGF